MKEKSNEPAIKVFLIGMPGSGKSYWAKKLAKKLKTGAYDLDFMVEAYSDQTITEIFAEPDGEENFRKTESKLLRWFGEKKNYVLATGGGTPCFHGNMDWMNKEGLTIYLNEDATVLFDRLKIDKENRPMICQLSDPELMKFIVSKKEERDEFYSKAKLVFNGSDVNEKTLVEAVKAYMAKNDIK